MRAGANAVAPPPQSRCLFGHVLAILILAQATVAPPAPASDLLVIDASPADRATYKSPDPSCRDTLPSGEDVVVCARMADMPKSLAEQAAIFEPKPFRPAWKLGPGEVGVRAEQRGTPMGSAPAAMATFKLKF